MITFLKNMIKLLKDFLKNLYYFFKNYLHPGAYDFCHLGGSGIPEAVYAYC
jgi:hypothetical protein